MKSALQAGEISIADEIPCGDEIRLRRVALPDRLKLLFFQRKFSLDIWVCMLYTLIVGNQSGRFYGLPCFFIGLMS